MRRIAWLIALMFISAWGATGQAAVRPEGSSGASPVRLERVVSGLSQPIHVTHAGDQRLFVVERAGRIRILANGQLLAEPFLDLTDRVGSRGQEQGLLSVAFPADYARSGTFFVNYTDRQGDTVVARFKVSSNPQRADPRSERVVLRIPQPAANHNGGLLVFGPDGYLYIGTGDGGGAGDPQRNAQNLGVLLGKLLRIDVSREPYAIPPDNPFVNRSGVRPEIWAYGLRNPWRFAFDAVTGDLFIADVGQNALEEVNRQPAGSRGGENYGWNIMEGTQCYPASRPCSTAELTLPVAEYPHALGCSITGGEVYRGREISALIGAYLFSDFCTGRLWALERRGDQDVVRELMNTGLQVTSFGTDHLGEVYLTDFRGSLWRLKKAG